MSCEETSYQELYRQRFLQDLHDNFDPSNLGAQISAGFSALSAAMGLVPGLASTIEGEIGGAASALASVFIQGAAGGNVAGAASGSAIENMLLAIVESAKSFVATAEAEVAAAAHALQSANAARDLAVVDQAAKAQALEGANAAKGAALAQQQSAAETLQNAIANSSGSAADIAEIQNLQIAADQASATAQSAEAAASTAAEVFEAAEAVYASTGAEVAAAIAGEAATAAELTTITAAVGEFVVAAGPVLATIAAAIAAWAVATLAGTEIQAGLEALRDYENEPPCPNPDPKHPHPGTPPTFADPLVLDLTGAGISLTALNGSQAYFDYTGSNVRTETGWIGAGQGLLVTAPADGSTVTAANVLGVQSGSGFADLAALDSNGDGVIDAQDSAFANLRVWVDASGDGQSSADELCTLTQLGITSIAIDSTASGESNNGNAVVATGTFSITDPYTGVTSTNTIAEINFQTSPQITVLPPSSTPLTQDALNLPNLAGFGLMPDLSAAISNNTTLEHMVRDLVANSAAMTSAQFNTAFQAVLYEWAGATNVSPTAYGPYIDGREVAVIYTYFGINSSTDPYYVGREPNWHNGPSVWEPTYQQILQYYELAFISQIPQSLISLGVDTVTAQASPYASFALLGYSPSTNELLGDARSLPSLMAAMAPADPAAAESYWGQVQGGIQLINYALGDEGIDGAVLKLIAQSKTETDALIAVNAMNSVSPVFNVITADGYANISCDSVSVTYAGMGAVEIPAEYSDFVVVSPGCTQLKLDNSNSYVTIVLQGANGFADVTFSTSGSTLIATFRDGSTLDLINQAATDVTGQATIGTLMFKGGTVIPQIEIANDIIANKAGNGSRTVEGYAIGGILQGAAGNDVLIANANPFGPSDGSNASLVGIGKTVFDVGAGNNVLVTSFGSTNVSGVQDVINYDVGSGNELVYTVVNQNYDPRLVNHPFAIYSPSPLGAYVNTLLSNVFPYFSSPYNPVPRQISQNSIDFGAGIAVADISISAAGSSVAAINAIYAADQTTGNFVNYFYVNGGELNPWSLVITIDGIKTITFTGGADTLQAINFADGTVMTAQQIGDAYVASEEAQNFAFIQGTELGNTLQGTVGNQVLLGFSGNDTLIAGAGNDTLMAGGGINSYVVNSNSGDVTIINNRLSDHDWNAPESVGSGFTEMDDTLIFGAGIDPLQVTAMAVASISGSEPGLPDILLTIAGTGQTIRLTDQNQGLASFGTLDHANNGAAVGQIKFADGTVWTPSDLLGMVSAAIYTAESAAYPGYTLVEGALGNATLESGATPKLLAGGLGSDTFVINRGDASVVVNCGLNGAGGGDVDQSDHNVLQLGTGISEDDIAVVQAANGNDIVLTVGSTGQTVILANQLTRNPGSVIQEVKFADGTTWTNADLFKASVSGSLAAGAPVIYGSVSISDLGIGHTDIVDAIADGGLNIGDASATLVGRGSVQFFKMGTGSETAVVSSRAADIEFLPSFDNDTIELTGDASDNFDGILLFDGALPSGAQWSADGKDLILSFSDQGRTLTLANFNGASGVRFAQYNVSEDYISGVSNLLNLFPSILSVNGVAGQAILSVRHDYMTIDPAGNASTVNIVGNSDTVVYRRGYGAVNINITDNEREKFNTLSLQGTYTDPLAISVQPGESNYSIDSAGNLTLDFGNGDVVTIEHEFDADGAVSANGIQRIFNANAPGIDLSALGYEAREFDAAVGQTSLTGDGRGGIFNPEGVASSVSDGGVNTDTIIYNSGFGALTIGQLSTNGNNAIEFGTGITLASLAFSANSSGDLVILLGDSGDQITIKNGLGLTQAINANYAFGLTNLLFADGSSASLNGTGIFGSNGNSVAIDMSALKSGILAGDGEAQSFRPSGLVHRIEGGGGADVITYYGGQTGINFNGRDGGALVIDETYTSDLALSVLNITDANLPLTGGGSGSYGDGGGSYGGGSDSYGGGSGSYGGGGSSYGGGTSTTDLGSVVGVTANENGDVTIYLGNGDNITLLGQLADTPGVAHGVGTIHISNGANTDIWTNTDIVNALAYEASTGIVPNKSSDSQNGDGGSGTQTGPFSYRRGDGAVTIDASATSSSNNILNINGLLINNFPGSVNYTINAAGDLTFDFGGGDVLTILHEFNSDGSVASNGIHAINSVSGYFPSPDLTSDDLSALRFEIRQFDPVPGQTNLDGDGRGGIFNPAGIATEISDSGTSIDTIRYNPGDGPLTINDLSANYENSIVFGAGISLSSLTFAADASGDLIISAGGNDQITIKNGLWLTTTTDAYPVDYLVFSNGISAYSWGSTIYGSDGSTASIDVSALANTALTGDAGAQVFQGEGVVHNIVGGGGADQINYNGGEGQLTVNETDTSSVSSSVLTIFDSNLHFVPGAGTGGTPPDLGSVVGVTENSAGDVTLHLGSGDNITLLGQLASPTGTAQGVSSITAFDSNYNRVAWTNTDILNALDYEASTGVVPNYVGAPSIAIASETVATGSTTEQANVTGSSSIDTSSGTILFTDASSSPSDSVSVTSVSTDGSAAGLPSNAALLAMLSLGAVSEPASGNAGSVAWTFGTVDSVFDYLATGETVTLTYEVKIANPSGGSATQNVTVTVTGTNDAPVIVAGSSGASLAFTSGASTTDAGVGTIQFTDADLSDTHLASIGSVTASGATDGLPANSALLGLLSVALASDDTSTTPGSANWSFSAADTTFKYLAPGQTLTLTYGVNVADNQGGVAAQNVVVTVTGGGGTTKTYTASGTFAGVAYASYANAYTARGWRYLQTFYDGAGNVVASESFTSNGGYAITVGGAVKQVKTVNTDGSYDIRYNVGGTFQGVAYASYDNAYNTSNFRNLETFYDAAGNVVASESFTSSGGYTITVAGVVTQVKTVNTDGSYDIRYNVGGAFQGVSYASYDNAYNTSNFRNVETFYDAAGNMVASESFTANGGYAITIGGAVTQVKTVNANGSYDIRYNVGGTFQGVSYASYDNAYNTSNFRNVETFYDGAGNAVTSENFTSNGGYAITVGGVVTQTKMVNADGSYQLNYTNVTGKSYTQAQYAYSNAGTKLALAETLTNGSNATFLYSAGLTLSDIGGIETLSNGTDTFQLGSDTHGSIDVTSAPNAALAFGLGDGLQTVSGFATSGSGADNLVFSKDIFADWAHLLGATTQVGNDLQITLDPSDTVLLKNVALASFTSANAHFV